MRARARRTLPGANQSVSPRISGSFGAAAQATSICGSDNSNALSRSVSACKRHDLVARIGFDAQGSPARANMRSSQTGLNASSAKIEREQRDVLAAKRCDGPMDSVNRGRTQAARRRRAGEPGKMKRFAMTKAARNPPRHGRERSLSFAVRIVSGIQTVPQRCEDGVRHAVSHESVDFTPKGNRAERVQTVNGGPIGVRQAVRALFRHRHAPDHVVDIDAAERHRDGSLGFSQRRPHHFIDED